MSAQTISHDKLNQLGMFSFSVRPEKILIHMQKLADLLRPNLISSFRNWRKVSVRILPLHSGAIRKEATSSPECLRRMRKTDGRVAGRPESR